MRTTHTPAHRRSVGLIGLLALLLTALIGAGSATAAPPYTTEATITSVDFTQDTVVSGSRAEIKLTWALPDGPNSPAGLVVDLPPELRGRTDAFPLLDPDGVELAQCTVTQTQIYCDFDEAYLADHPRDIHGDLFFWVDVRSEVTEETEVVYEFDDVQGTVTVTPPASNVCPENCEFTGRGSYKWGTYDAATGTIYWRVVVAAPAEGMADDLEVTVTDHVGPAQEITDVQVRHTNELVTDANGWEVPGRYTVLEPSRYSLSEDLSTVTFRSEQGYFYVVDYYTEATDGGASAEYTNAADITIEGETTRTVRSEVINQRGGGSGSGTDVGMFTITKEVTGDAEAAAGVTFTGTYEVTTPEGDVIDGSFEVTAGSTWASGEFPPGSTVRLSEDVPTEPANVGWAEPVFSENDLVLEAGSTTAVTLTNEASLLTGSFSVAKAITGDGADLVPADATFVVTYAYPAGSGFEAGTGELVVPADGTVVVSEEIPAGAVVTLTEVTPESVPGMTWGEPVFSVENLTVVAGETVAVELTNTATAQPPTPTPADPVAEQPTAGNPAAALPNTGADASLGALIAALTLVTAGVATLALRRRQQR